MIRINADEYDSIKDGLVAALRTDNPINTIYYTDKAYLYDRNEQTLTDISACICSNSEPIDPIQGFQNIYTYLLFCSPVMSLVDNHNTTEIWETKVGYVVTHKDTDKVFENFSKATTYALSLM